MPAQKDHIPVITVHMINMASHVFAEIPQVFPKLEVIVANKQDTKMPRGVVQE
jgi:hypothetical protein